MDFGSSGGTYTGNANPSGADQPAAPIAPAAIRKAQAAAFTGLSERTLDRLRTSGRIPFAKIGGCVVFPVDGLRRFIADQVAAAAAKAAAVAAGGAL